MKHLINKVINYFFFSDKRYYYYSREVYDERYIIDFQDEDDERDYKWGKKIYEWKFGKLDGTLIKDIQNNCKYWTDDDYFLSISPQLCIIKLYLMLLIDHQHIRPIDNPYIEKPCPKCSEKVSSGEWEKELELEIKYEGKDLIILNH